MEELSGIKQSTIFRIIKKLHAAPNAETIVNIANFFNVNPSYIFGWDDRKEFINWEKVGKSLVETSTTTIEAYQGRDSRFISKLIFWEFMKEYGGLPEKAIAEELAKLS